MWRSTRWTWRRCSRNPVRRRLRHRWSNCLITYRYHYFHLRQKNQLSLINSPDNALTFKSLSSQSHVSEERHLCRHYYAPTCRDVILYSLWCAACAGLAGYCMEEHCNGRGEAYIYQNECIYANARRVKQTRSSSCAFVVRGQATVYDSVKLICSI